MMQNTLLRIALGSIGYLLALTWPCLGWAHGSEGGFVLLLPTDVYMMAGVQVVALTFLLLVLVRDAWIIRLFDTAVRWQLDLTGSQAVISLISFALMVLALCVGFAGSRDPLSNMLPLSFWTIGWVALVCLAGIFGNLWLWLNPWTGLYRLVGAPDPILQLPERLGVWPACVMLLAFSAFLLAYPATDDPAILATYLGAYWVLHMLGLVLFGPIWLQRAEIATVLFDLYGRISPVYLGSHQIALGGPGAQILQHAPVAGLGGFALLLLGLGSFDGINETFWWLARIGINPLEFPGRSAVIVPTLIGLALGCLLVVFTVGFAIWLGWTLMGQKPNLKLVLNWMALSLLPIALAYHFAHYLPSFLVYSQYALAALSDPFATGADLLGLQPFYVTTGFFNRIDTVRVIWLSQAGAVVFGHIWSLLLSHAIALKLAETGKDALKLTLPLSVMMISYTFLGLWLLAAAKGA